MLNTGLIGPKDSYLELADMITGKEIAYLTPAQEKYLQKHFDRLPDWCQNIINSHLNGECWSDAYAELGKLRLNKAIEIAKIAIDQSILTLHTDSFEDLQRLARCDAKTSYDDAVKSICEKATIEDRHPRAEQEFRNLFDIHFASSISAMIDCDILLSQTAFRDELNRFRHAVCQKFPEESLQDGLSYTAALATLEDIAKAEANGEEHFTKAIADTISKLRSALINLSYPEINQGRKNHLIRLLPIDASIEHIKWALNEDNNCASSTWFILKPSRVEQLLNLGYKTMADLIDRPIDDKYIDLKAAVQKLLDYIQYPH